MDSKRYYFTRGTDTATAEEPETCDRLEARGFVKCTHAHWRAVSAARDAARRSDLVGEDAIAIQHMSYVERVRAGV